MSAKDKQVKIEKMRGAPAPRDVTEAKLALLAARERGEPDALRSALRARPAHADMLLEFDLGLLATARISDAEADAADVLEAAEVGRARAFAAVFGVAPAAVAQASAQPATAQAGAQAALSLQGLRKARGQSLPGLAAALGLGIDVLSALEKGRIRVASVPQRLLDSLAELLDATAEQVNGALAVAVAPALRRGQSGAPASAARAAAAQQLDFSEAVMLSQSMTGEQRAHWLGER